MSKEIFKTNYSSPLGILEIKGTEKGIQSIDFIGDKGEINEDIPEVLKECVLQLKEFFKGERKEFSVKINPKGSAFQVMVWNHLQKIPFGETRSYLDVAISVGNKKATRAVGNANKCNPIPIIVPCHRVVGTDGKLTGFAGGLGRKKWLLEFEKPLRQTRLFEKFRQE